MTAIDLDAYVAKIMNRQPDIATAEQQATLRPRDDRKWAISYTVCFGSHEDSPAIAKKAIIDAGYTWDSDNKTYRKNEFEIQLTQQQGNKENKVIAYLTHTGEKIAIAIGPNGMLRPSDNPELNR
jgi:hypothetical protein